MGKCDYFDKLSLSMGLEAKPVIKASPLRKSLVQFTRMTSERADHGMLTSPVEKAYCLNLQMREIPRVDFWTHGKHHVKDGQKRGRFSLVNLNVEMTMEMNFPFDSIKMHIPESALKEVAEEVGEPDAREIDLNYMESTEDATIQHLAACLLPAFENPSRVNQLFVDSVSTALLAHMVQLYGCAKSAAQTKHSKLAPWQVHRVKEYMSAHLDGDISIDDLSRECGLSRSYFSRAFKSATGTAPHSWLMDQRIERAKGLLLRSPLSLAEIATICGFADQSHFTRSFTSRIGCTPGKWREIQSHY